MKLDEFCLARSCYLSKAKRERDSLAYRLDLLITRINTLNTTFAFR